MPRKENEIPTTVMQWKTAARSRGVLGTINMLGSQEKVKSASKFEFNHFLGLRVIYEKPKKKLPSSITGQCVVDPGLSLDKLGGWNAYLEEIQNSRSRNDTGQTIFETCVPANLEGLANVWQFQRHILLMNTESVEDSKLSEVTPVIQKSKSKSTTRLLFQRSPTPAPKTKLSTVSYPTTEMQDLSMDPEDINEINDIFRDVMDNDNDPDNVWEEEAEPELLEPGSKPEDYSPYPPPRFRGPKIRDEQTVNVFLLAFLAAITCTTKVKYNARTDGHLRNENDQIFSLIEVKPHARDDQNVRIRMQESAQMAAYISQNKMRLHDPEKDCRIFLLSQDKDEIFLTFPHFEAAYGDDTKAANEVKRENFLRMCEYGPFRLNSKADVRYVANFLQGYTLSVSRT